MRPHILVTSKLTTTFPANPVVGDYYTVVQTPDYNVTQYVYDGCRWLLFSSHIAQQLNIIKDDPIEAYDYAMGVI